MPLYEIIEHKTCVLILSTTSVWNIFHSKKNWASSSVSTVQYSSRYSFQILTNLEFSQYIFEKYSNVEFPFCGGRVVPGVWTDVRKDGHDGAAILQKENDAQKYTEK